MIFLLLTVVAAALAVLVLTIVCRPVIGIYGGLLFGGVLISPSLPGLGDKLALPDIPLVIVIFSALLHALASGKSRVGSPAVISCITFGAMFLASSYISFFWAIVFHQAEPLNSFVSVLNYTYGFLLTLIILVFVGDWEKWQSCITYWLLGGAIVSIVAIIAISGLGFEWAFHGSRIKSTMQGVNQVPAYLAPLILIIFGCIVNANNSSLFRVFCVGVLLASLITLLATGSRSSVILALLALVACFIFIVRNTGVPRFVRATAAAFSALALLSLFSFFFVVSEAGVENLPPGMQAVARPINLLSRIDSLEEELGPRAEQLKIVSENWWKNPVLGIGPSNFQNFYSHRHELHNTYFGVLMEHGILGLVLLLLFLISIFRAGYQILGGARLGSKSVILGLTLLSFFILCVYGISSFGLRQRMFWVLPGLILAAVEIVYQSNKRESRMFSAETTYKS